MPKFFEWLLTQICTESNRISNWKVLAGSESETELNWNQFDLTTLEGNAYPARCLTDVYRDSLMLIETIQTRKRAWAPIFYFFLWKRIMRGLCEILVAAEFWSHVILSLPAYCQRDMFRRDFRKACFCVCVFLALPDFCPRVFVVYVIFGPSENLWAPSKCP